MIKITIFAEGGKVFDETESRDSTFAENSMAVRRLEEIKLRLLDMEYEVDYQEETGGEEDG